MFTFISVGSKQHEWFKQLSEGIGNVYEFLNVTAIQENTQEGTCTSMLSYTCNVLEMCSRLFFANPKCCDYDLLSLHWRSSCVL